MAGTTQVDATLLVEGDAGDRRPLSIDDFKTDRTGAATHADAAALLTELGQKLEPGDLAALATTAKQDLAKAVLDSILTSVDGVEGLLTAIRDRLPFDATTVSSESTQLIVASRLLLEGSGEDAATLLDAIRTRLAGTLTVGLPAGAATAANQASEIADLADLLSRVGPTASDNLLALLRQIVANTAAESATVTHLDLTADTLNLSTDNLEGLLSTLNGLVASEATLGTVSGRLGTVGFGSIAALLDAVRTALAGTLTVGLPTGAATDTKSEAIRALLAGTLTVAPTTAGDVAATLTDGRKTVTTPGTAVALRTSLACKWVCVTALKTNTDQVNVGGSAVIATAGSSTGSPLSAGESVTIPASNASLVFVDARVSGEGVSFTVGS